jgi:hypothetical protein
MPERFRVRYASTAAEVLNELQKFVEYVKTGPVITLLPTTLQALSSDDAAEVVRWQQQIAHELSYTRPLGATTRCWLSLLDEMFRGARQRLDELAHAAESGASPPVASNSSATPPPPHS